MSMKKAVLFDFDGVLFDSMHRAHRGVCEVFLESGLNVPGFEEFYKTLEVPFATYYRKYGVRAPMEEIWKLFLKGAGDEVLELFPEVQEVLQNLAEKGLVLGIATSNAKDFVEKNLKRTKIHPHFHFVACGDTKLKVATIRKFFKQHHVAPQNVLFVGDMPSDIRDGRKAGVKTVGYISRKEARYGLERAKPDHLIVNLKKILEFV